TWLRSRTCSATSSSRFHAVNWPDRCAWNWNRPTPWGERRHRTRASPRPYGNHSAASRRGARPPIRSSTVSKSQTIILDGNSLTRSQVVQVARGARVALDGARLGRVQRTADFLAEKVSCGEPIYGVTTGFGSNADKLLGAHRVRDELPGGNPDRPAGTLLEELQHNLIVTPAVCVGEPFAAEVVRAMLVIRINTLMRGHSGIRAVTLNALADLLNRDVVPVIPQKGSVGASGDLAPLSHLAIVLLGGGEAFYQGERMAGADALKRAGLKPIRLSFKEGLALNNGTPQMLATSVPAL